MSEFKKKLNSVKGFVFDVDGVFTDGKIMILPDGQQIRNMNVKDGYAVHFAAKKGYHICIITGGKCNSIRIRFQELGINDIFIASKDKRDDFQTFLTKYNLSKDEVLYMGDDLPDLLVMKQAGISACPNDAVPEIMEIADYISNKRSGEGCVRDVVEQTLKLQGKWADSDAFVW